MCKALARTELTERFQERDLRAKTASDSATLEEASERLAHASTAITKRVYRRKPTKVKPLIPGATITRASRHSIDDVLVGRDRESLIDLLRRTELVLEDGAH
jgi:hypothetical protein